MGRRLELIALPPLVALAMLGACTRSSATTTASGSADAGPSPSDAGRDVARTPRAPSAPNALTSVLGVTRDGKRALVRIDDFHGHLAPSPYRWIDVATGAMLSEWTLPMLGIAAPAVPPPAALEHDVAKHAAALLELDEPHDERFAVGKTAVVFNEGDWLHVADPKTGKVGPRLAADASYYPQIDPDGAFVVYSRMQGSLDGVVGNYMPFIAPLPAGAPSRRLEVRDVGGEEMRISPDGLFLYARSGVELPRGGCLVRVTIAPPSPTKKLFCVDAGDDLTGVRFSPSRTFLVVLARTGSTGPVRATFLHLPEGTVIGVLKESSAFDVATVDDLGVGLGTGLTPGGPDVARIDPASRSLETFVPGVRLPPAFYGAAWLTGNRYAVGDDGGIAIVEIATAAKTPRPWPAGP